jgi:transposase
MTDTKARKLSVVRNSSDALRLDQGETVHVGVDVPKATYHVALSSGTRGLLATWVQPARPELLRERLAPIQGPIAGVVSEAGPTGFSLARHLRAAGLPAQVIATSKALAPVGQDAKCDRLDCRRLALLSSKGLLHPVRIPTEPEEADRPVLRLREQLVRKSRSIQQPVKAFLLQHGIGEPDGLAHWAERAVEALRRLELLPELRFCLDVMLDELEHVNRQVKRITRRLDELSQAERHRSAAGVMRTVPGVGLVPAMTFRLELPEPGRFAHAGQVARRAGLAPMVRQSGETRREGGLIRSSSGRLRTAPVESAWRWVAPDEAAKAVYRRLVGNTGSGKEAIVGVARRLGVLLWRLSCRGEPHRAAA